MEATIRRKNTGSGQTPSSPLILQTLVVTFVESVFTTGFVISKLLSSLQSAKRWLALLCASPKWCKPKPFFVHFQVVYVRLLSGKLFSPKKHYNWPPSTFCWSKVELRTAFFSALWCRHCCYQPLSARFLTEWNNMVTVSYVDCRRCHKQLYNSFTYFENH